MVEVRQVSRDEANRLLVLEESHFLDLKSIDTAPAKLTDTVSAFANTAGGEIFLGVDERVWPKKVRAWRGFSDIEAANAHIAAIEAMSPLGNHLIFKTKEILSASSGTVYVRRGAQKQPVEGEEVLKRLRLDKGIVSFESETIAAPIDRISNSSVIIEFILAVVPTAEPAVWLEKQNLIVAEKPTAGGVLLFADEPQSLLPKRSAIKVYRYKTRDEVGSRDTLAGDPLTIEGCLYQQIKNAVRTTKEVVEGMKRLGEERLEGVIYPDETLHEIITNAVLHRDYSIAADVHVRIYDNRIEVESPGRRRLYG